jgi:hypothetical protein
MAWKWAHKPSLSTLDATEAMDFQINTGQDNPIYVPSQMMENAAYQTPI